MSVCVCAPCVTRFNWELHCGPFNYFGRIVVNGAQGKHAGSLGFLSWAVAV